MKGCYSKFDDPDEVISTVQHGDVMFAEMWRGPTGAFKDLSLVVLARMVGVFLRRRGQRSVVLVSTSGDTGSAAIHSVAGMETLIQLMVMYPRHMISRTQRLQMTTVSAPNVRVFSVDGTSDDTDVVMTKLFADSAFSGKHNLNVFNSLNVCRLLVQAIHFIYLYLKACPEADRDVLFCVPTGGMGNVSSGMVARGMGVPVRFVAAVNENDTVFQTLRTGRLKVPATVHKTLSCAMDINVPYNMERLLLSLALLAQGNPPFPEGKSPFEGKSPCDVVREMMEEFERSGECAIPAEVMDANTMVSSVCVQEDSVLATMREIWETHGYLICPHTAVATRAALDILEGEEEGRGEKVVVICTATPAKFSEAVEKAGLTLPPSEKFDCLEKLPEHKLFMDKGEDWYQRMRKEIENAWN